MDVDSESVSLSNYNELVKEALHQSMEAHKHNKFYLTNSKRYITGSSSSMEAQIFAFKGCLEVNDLYHGDLFGETYVDPKQFPSLLRIGVNQLAKVNMPILQIFQDLLSNSKFKLEVEKAVMEGKKMLSTGHSTRGALASLATLWVLDEYKRKQQKTFLIHCITFGSPLIGDENLAHAVRREIWAGHFTHFVMEHDIVPCIMLAPKPSIQEYLPNI